jgi:hypothetical protein
VGVRLRDDRVELTGRAVTVLRGVLAPAAGPGAASTATTGAAAVSTTSAPTAVPPGAAQD